MHDVDVVSWDVDGTLYDMRKVMGWVLAGSARGLTRPGARRAWQELERLRRFRKAMAAVRARGGELGPSDIPEDRAQLIALEQRWYAPAIQRAGLLPEVERSIRALASAGKRQIIVSDYHSDYKLRLFGLEDVFERVYAGENLGHLKPSPELFRAVARDLDVAPDRILHIGDRADRDGTAAEGAGCRVRILGRDPLPVV